MPSASTAFRSLVLKIQDAFCDFDPTAYRYATPTLSGPLAPVFLLGAPRTGSTLFFQYATLHLKIAYISNLMALVPRFMVRLTRLSPRVATGAYRSIRSSDLGFVPGLLAPNEAAAIMRLWFDDSALPERDKLVRASVAAMTTMTQAPMFFKNLTNTIRADRILAVLPQARFIHLRRSPLYTAQSILLVRRRLGSEQSWWSVRPPGYEDVVDEDPYYQVLWQAVRMQALAAAFCLAHPERCVQIDYEGFCANPGQTLRGLAESFGIQHRDPNAGDRGARIRESRRQRLPQSEWQHLRALYDANFRSSQSDGEATHRP